MAGAAAACRLAAAGWEVVLFEREPEPRHKVCGEFVSGDALSCLTAMDVTAEAAMRQLGAEPVERVRLVAGRRVAAAPLPFRAFGLSRRRLDGWLLTQAARRGARIALARPVRRVRADGEGWALDLADATARAGRVLLATGKHDLRERPRRWPASPLIGLKLHLRLEPCAARALRGHVELALFPGGYAGLVGVEGGMANLCLVITKDRFAAVGRKLERLIASVPHLAKRLGGAAACWDRPLAIYGTPYGFIHRQQGEPGLYRLGDQMAVIPSFTGDGMAMALCSAEAAAAAILADEPAQRYHQAIARGFARPMRLAGMLAGLGSIPPLQAPLVALAAAAPHLLAAAAARTRAAA